MKEKTAYVVGSSARKSLSPTIFNYWFKKYNVEGKYFYKEIKEEKFDEKIKTILKEEKLYVLLSNLRYPHACSSSSTLF